MTVGITYDLRSEYLAMGYSFEETAELDKEDTIDHIDSALQSAGYQTDRIGHYLHLLERLGRGDRWDIVFNICEGMFGDGRESLVPSILDAYKVPYVFSGPATLAVSLNKYLTKRVVRDAGVPTPDFRILSGKKDLDLEKPPFPLFVKPVSEGTGKGISNRSVIKEESEFRTVCSELIDRYHQPVLVEEYLPGREFTAGVVGTGMEARVIGVMEVCYEGDILPVYSYENKENWKGRVDYRRVEESIYDECREVTLKVWNALMARDGGRVDLRMNARGKINFIEVNPLAGLNADISDLPILARMHGITFPQLIDMIMTSAIERVFIHHG